MPKQNRKPGIHLHKTTPRIANLMPAEYYWILIAKNGKTIARSSEMYKRKGSAVKSIEVASDIFLCKSSYYDHTTDGANIEQVNY